MAANLNPSYAPIGGGGRTISIGVPDDLPTGYHWVRNLLNGQTTGGSQGSYSTGTNNSNFTEGSTNCLSAVYAKDAGNTGPGALEITIPLGCIRTGADPAPPTVSVDVSSTPGYSGLKADYSGDGLVAPFKCKISTVPGVGESGVVTVNYTPPTGFKGILWYTVYVGGYVAGVSVNQNYAGNDNYSVRGIPMSESGWNRGGGQWRGTQRALIYPISTNLQSYVVAQNSSTPNFIIGEANNADGVDSLSVQITRGDYWDYNKLARENSGNPVLMSLASGYTTTYGYGGGENGRTYVPPDENNAGCVSFRPADSVELSPYNVIQANSPGVPLGGAYVLSNNQCGTPFVDCPYFIAASPTILQTDVTITVYLEKAPDPIPAITSAGAYCYATGGTVTMTGSNLSAATKVYDAYGNVITGATVTPTGDTSAEVTIPASSYGGAIGLSSASGQIGWTNASNTCPPEEPTYPNIPRVPNPSPAPTPTTPVPSTCMSGWTFGVVTNTTILGNGPKIVSYDGTVFVAPRAGIWSLSAVDNSLTFNKEEVHAENGVYLNPGLGEIIRIADWGYPYDGTYYVIANSDTSINKRLQLSCTNTSLTPTPSPIQTGTCIAPANTNTGPFAFPTSPSINQIYSFNGRAWYWNSYAWNRYCVGVTPILSQICPPLSGILYKDGVSIGNLSFTYGALPYQAGAIILSYNSNTIGTDNVSVHIIPVSNSSAPSISFFLFNGAATASMSATLNDYECGTTKLIDISYYGYSADISWGTI